MAADVAAPALASASCSAFDLALRVLGRERRVVAVELLEDLLQHGVDRPAGRAVETTDVTGHEQQPGGLLGVARTVSETGRAPCRLQAGTRRRVRRQRDAEPLWGGRSCALRHASARSVTKPAVTCLTAAAHLLIMPGSHSPGGRGLAVAVALPAQRKGRTERLPMRRRSSLFAAVAGPRAKWLVFGVWFVVIFAVVLRRRAREVHGRPGERVDVVPARRRRVDQGADRRPRTCRAANSPRR